MWVGLPIKLMGCPDGAQFYPADKIKWADMWVAHMSAQYGPNWTPHAIVHWVQTVAWELRPQPPEAMKAIFCYFLEKKAILMPWDHIRTLSEPFESSLLHF